MSNDLLLIDAAHLSKRFSRSLKHSLWYGVQDIAREFVPTPRVERAHLRQTEFWALDDISFQLKRGQALGVLGNNGAGKSTLLKILNGLVKPDGGRVTVRGRVGAMIELGAGFSPILTGRENIYNSAAVLGLNKKQVNALAEEILEFADIGEFIDMPVQQYSSGMWARLAYAVAAHLFPDILLVDEVLAVGDLEFRRKCMQHMLRYVENGGALIFVSHNLHQLQSLCPQSVLLSRGRVTFHGSSVAAVEKYLAEQSGGIARVQTETLAPADTAPVQIEKIELCAVDGGALKTGEPARLVVHYHARKNWDAVFFSWMVWSADLNMCIGAAMADMPTGKINRGRGCIECRVLHFPLHAGTFALRASLLDENYFLLAERGWESPPYYFTVMGEATRASNARSRFGALIAFEVEW